MKFTIKQAREYRGLTQREAASRLGIALSTYRLYEWGDLEMKIGMAKRFADMVDMPLDQLIFYTKAS